MLFRSYEFGAHHLGAVACAMLARYPDLHIDLDVDYERLDPLNRRYDIVFSMFDAGPPGSGHVAQQTFSIPRGVFAAPVLLERCRPIRAPQDLAEVPAIANAFDAQWTFTDNENREIKVPVRPRMRSPNADVRRRATIAGLGISRIVRTFCVEAVRSRKLKEVLPEYGCAPLRIYALLPGRRLMPPKVRLFLDMLGDSEVK